MPIITPPEMDKDCGIVTASKTIEGWWLICGDNGYSIELFESEIENLHRLVQEKKAEGAERDQHG